MSTPSAKAQKPLVDKTYRACDYCAKKKLKCENARPCFRCIREGRADKCKDARRRVGSRRKRRKRSIGFSRRPSTIATDSSDESGAEEESKRILGGASPTAYTHLTAVTPPSPTVTTEGDPAAKATEELLLASEDSHTIGEYEELPLPEPGFEMPRQEEICDIPSMVGSHAARAVIDRNQTDVIQRVCSVRSVN